MFWRAASAAGWSSPRAATWSSAAAEAAISATISNGGSATMQSGGKGSSTAISCRRDTRPYAGTETASIIGSGGTAGRGWLWNCDQHDRQQWRHANCKLGWYIATGVVGGSTTSTTLSRRCRGGVPWWGRELRHSQQRWLPRDGIGCEQTWRPCEQRNHQRWRKRCDWLLRTAAMMELPSRAEAFFDNGAGRRSPGPLS